MKLSKTSMIVVFIVFFSMNYLNGYSQKSTQTAPENNIEIIIPIEYKSDKSLNSNGLSYYEAYSPIARGKITFTFDENNKFVQITAPQVASKNALVNENNQVQGPVADCTKNCGGTWACLVACLIDRIEESTQQTN